MRNTIIVASAILLALTAFIPTQESPQPHVTALRASQFSFWLSETGTHYETPSEYSYRLSVFSKNIALVESHNLKDLSWKMGLTFADMTDKEILAKHTGLKFTDFEEYAKKIPRSPTLTQSAPESRDWVAEGKLNPVKNQGSCGSCWAFSAVAQLEARELIQNNRRIQLSEQQLVDCTREYGNNGCSGGLMNYAYEYGQDVGLTSEEVYPYTGTDDSCRIDESTIITRISQHSLKDQGEDSLLQTIGLENPTANAVNAEPLIRYSSGIFDGACNEKGLNHAVNVVGYGSEDGKDFWLVRNSWGENWGEKGYFRLGRNSGTNVGTCGIATFTFQVEVNNVE